MPLKIIYICYVIRAIKAIPNDFVIKQPITKDFPDLKGFVLQSPC